MSFCRNLFDNELYRLKLQSKRVCRDENSCVMVDHKIHERCPPPSKNKKNKKQKKKKNGNDSTTHQSLVAQVLTTDCFLKTFNV
jgi:hypothetical protein